VILPFVPQRADGRRLELLCIGAHSDDIEIGCAGMVLRLLQDGVVGAVTWVVLSGDARRAAEARCAAERILDRHPDVRVVQQTFRESYFPYVAVPIKEFFDQLGREVTPDIVFTHYRSDRHQDHRLVSELTYNTFRNHMILEYEIMKTDGDLGRPNVYAPLDQATVHRKNEIIRDSFVSQHDKPWFDEEVFASLMRLRGVEAGAPSGYAEAFYARKLVI
jgi:LmbE family N-acetylglucosaminyl deacetylase